MLGLVQIVFALILSVVLFDIDWGPEKLMVGVVLLSWAAFNTSLAMYLANLARSEGQMSGIGVMATMAFAALGGCWWPIEVTPDWMHSLAGYLPTGWAMESMHRLVNFQEEGSAVLPQITALLTGTVVLGWLSRRTFRYQ
jgi:ABC-type multidrug transport system permease subunit